MSGPATAGAIPPAIHDDNDLGTTVLAQGSHSTGPAPAGRTGLMSWSWMHYLNSVSAADLIRSPLSLLFSGLSGSAPHFVTATGVGLWRVTSYGISLVMSGVLL